MLTPRAECGILGSHGVLACCPAACGACGGKGCESRPGGKACCALHAASFGPCNATGTLPCRPRCKLRQACCPHNQDVCERHAMSRTHDMHTLHHAANRTLPHSSWSTPRYAFLFLHLGKAGGSTVNLAALNCCVLKQQ